MAAYTITITNDGNAAIGPLFLQDLFPHEARFINTTIWPNQLDQNSSNWTLLHLSIGDTLIIGINLNVEKCEGDIINRAIVVGNCSLGQVWRAKPVDHRPGLAGRLPARGAGRWAVADLREWAAPAGNRRAANETDYLDATQMKMQWDNAGEDGGSCPLNCPEIEKAHASVQN